LSPDSKPHAYPQENFVFKIHHNASRRLKTNQNQNYHYPTNFCVSYKINVSCLIFVRCHRQAPEIILNEYFRNTKNAGEGDHKVFYEIKVHVVFLVLSLVFKTVFGIYLSPLVCLISGFYGFSTSCLDILKP
jgi:hypothetical protein